MPDPTVEAEVKPELGQPDNVAPGLDQELDAALGKMFTRQEEPKVEEKIQPKKEEVKQEIKAPVKNEVKTEVKTDLPAPESIDSSTPKKQDGWNALKSNYKRAHSLIKEREEEISKLKSTLAEKGTMTAKEHEALKKENEELARYRAMIDIQADPEFMTKYEKPIEKAINSAKQMLSGMNISKDLIDKVDFTNTKLMAEIIGHVGENRDEIVAKQLRRKVEEIIDLNDKRAEVLEEHKSKYKEHLESKKKESFGKQAEEEGRMLKRVQDVSVNIPFLVKQTAKDGAGEAEINNVNSHNSLVDIMTQRVHQVLRINNPEDKAEAAIAAVASHYLTAQLKGAMAKIKSLEDEIKKISNVTSETVKTKTKTSSNNGNGNLDLDSALNSHFSGR